MSTAAASPAAAAAASAAEAPQAAEQADCGADGADSADVILQYVVLRRDLWAELSWPLGSIVAQASSHAADHSYAMRLMLTSGATLRCSLVVYKETSLVHNATACPHGHGFRACRRTMYAHFLMHAH